MLLHNSGNRWGFPWPGGTSPFHPGKKSGRGVFFLPERKTDQTLGRYTLFDSTPPLFPMMKWEKFGYAWHTFLSHATVTEVHLTDEGYSMPVADAVSLNRLCLGFFLHAGVAPIREKPMETPKEQKYNLPGTLNNHFLMDVWWNNHFLCNDLESSSWNNHKKLDVWNPRWKSNIDTKQIMLWKM